MRGKRREAVEVCHGWQTEGVVEADLSRLIVRLGRFAERHRCVDNLHCTAADFDGLQRSVFDA
jgi:hypothetical protein